MQVPCRAVGLLLKRIEPAVTGGVQGTKLSPRAGTGSAGARSRQNYLRVGLAEHEKRATSGDTKMVLQLDGCLPHGLSVYERSVFRLQIDQMVMGAIRLNDEMPPRKSFVIDDDIG